MRITIIFIGLITFSCSFMNEDEDNRSAIARVNEQYLYLEDIEGVVPTDASEDDSSLIVDNYIQSWIKERLILQKAELNLKESQKDFEQQLEDYRNSLVIYNYEKELMKQKLDTNVSKEAIEKYYQENMQNFELRDDIVKVTYIKMLKSAPGLKRVRKKYKSNEPKDIEKLNELVHQYAEKFHLDDDKWILFDALKKEVPLEINQTANFLKNVKHIEVEDSLSHYFVKIKDYKLKNDVAPLSFEERNIRNIIINRRKLKLINHIKSDLFQEAFLTKKIEIYKPSSNEK